MPTDDDRLNAGASHKEPSNPCQAGIANLIDEYEDLLSNAEARSEDESTDPRRWAARGAASELRRVLNDLEDIYEN